MLGLRLGGIAALAAAVAGWHVPRGAQAAAAAGVLTRAAAEGLVERAKLLAEPAGAAARPRRCGYRGAAS